VSTFCCAIVFGMAVNWHGAYATAKTVLTNQEEEVPEHQQWFRRFEPQHLSEMIGNATQRQTVLRWFQNLRNQTGCSSLVIGGACGTGKTRTVITAAQCCGLRMVAMDMDEGKTASVVEGLVRKCRSEDAVLFVDDVHRLPHEGCTGMQYLLKAMKAPGSKLKVVCCYDGSQLSNGRLSPLIAAATAHLVYAPVPCADIQPYIQRIARRAGGDLGYFDALFISQKCRGDVRSALVKAEYLFHSRPLPVQRKKKKRVLRCSRILAQSGLCETGTLPDGETAADMMIRGDVNMDKTAESAACEGVSFARALNDKVHTKWLHHCDAETPLQAMSAIADAISASDQLLNAIYVDMEAVDDAKDAELVEYQFRPQAATLVLAGALMSGMQTNSAHKTSRRAKRLKFNSTDLNNRSVYTDSSIVSTRPRWC
jgi:hypothetical protein